MSDLIERLRRHGERFVKGTEYSADETIYGEAADLIEQQQLDKGVLEQELKVSNRNLRLADRKIEQQQRETGELKQEKKKTERLLRSSIDDDSNKAVSVVGAVQRYISFLENERDALEAHVATMIQAIQSNCYDDPSQAGQRLMKLAEQSPQISLAEHDREVRARQAEESWDEALDAYARLRGCPILEDELCVSKSEHANKIRNGKDGE